MSITIVPINGMDVPVIQYRGKRVITLSQMDNVHERPGGTAARTFRKHHSKLIRNEDYFVVTDAGEIREVVDATRLVPGKEAKDEIRTYSGGRGGKLSLLTRDGYLMLVKSFTDDLAWRVQKQLVKGYFEAGDNLGVDMQFLLTAPKPKRTVFPPEFFVELFRLTGKTPVPPHQARWISQKISNLIWCRVEDGVFDMLKSINPTVRAKSSGKLYRKYALSQFVANGPPMEKLIGFVQRCCGAMASFRIWSAFYEHWNQKHPVRRDLPHTVSVAFADDELLFTFMYELPSKTEGKP